MEQQTEMEKLAKERKDSLVVALNLTSKVLASIAICAAGAFCMWLTKDRASPTGIGWAVLGLAFIWS